jgi:hypothetical protein
MTDNFEQHRGDVEPADEKPMFRYRHRRITSGGIYLIRSPMDGNDVDWSRLASYEEPPAELVNAAIAKALESHRLRHPEQQ